MTFALATRTVPRRGGVDYLTPLRRRMDEIGAVRHPQVSGWHVSDRTDVTPNENALLALERAADDRSEWVLYLEDDVEPIDDLIGSTARWLQVHAIQAQRFYPLASAFTPDTDEAFWLYPLRWYYASQIMAMRTEDVGDFAAFVRGYWHHRRRAFDVALARWQGRCDPSTSTLRSPSHCFADHIGDVSTMGFNVGRFRFNRHYTYAPAR